MAALLRVNAMVSKDGERQAYRNFWQQQGRRAGRLAMFMKGSSSESNEVEPGLTSTSSLAGTDSRTVQLEDYPRSNLKIQKFRYTIFRTFEDPAFNVLAKYINIIVLVLILFSTVAFVLESIPSLADFKFWTLADLVVVAAFSAEYLARIFTAPNPLKFAITPLNMVDLLAILPFYIELLLPSGDNSSISNFRVLRAVRLMRVFRVFKLSKHSTHFAMFAQTLNRSSDALTMLLFIVVIAIVVFSGAIYYVEKGTYDPDRDVYIRPDNSIMEWDPFESIPAAFWWAIVTMTTVGYGDAVPVTAIGKVIAALAMLTGVLVVALPVTIVGSNFTEVYTLNRMDKTSVDVDEEESNDSLSKSGYGKLLAEVNVSRQQLVSLYMEVEAAVAKLRPAGSRPWNAIEQALFDNLIHDLTAIENFLGSFPSRVAEKEDMDASQQLQAQRMGSAEESPMAAPGEGQSSGPQYAPESALQAAQASNTEESSSVAAA